MACDSLPSSNSHKTILYSPPVQKLTRKESGGWVI